MPVVSFEYVEKYESLTAARAECERQYQEKVQEIITLTARVEELEAALDAAHLDFASENYNVSSLTARVAKLEAALDCVLTGRGDPVMVAAIALHGDPRAALSPAQPDGDKL